MTRKQTTAPDHVLTSKDSGFNKIKFPKFSAISLRTKEVKWIREEMNER